MSLGPSLLVVVIAALVAGAVALVVLGGPVSRDRLERFALRQRLLITPDNGERVIRYLAITRRWRSAGVSLGLVLPIVVGEIWQYLTGLTMHGNGFGWLFAGWFVGALAAEFRVNGRPSGTRRVATLHARTMRRYIGWWVWALVAVVTALAVVMAISRAVQAPSFDAAAPGAIAAITSGLVWFVARRVIVRAQPHLPADELAADEAIRSRSLHVLGGSGVAIASICLAQQLPRANHGGSFLLTLSGVAAGAMIATARFRVDDRSDHRDEVVA